MLRLQICLILKHKFFFVVDKNKTRAGGAFFPHLNNTKFDLDKQGVLNKLIEIIINITAYTQHCNLAVLSDIKLQQVVLTLRNRTIHKCDLENVCDALEINIELTSIRNGGDSRVEHYPKNQNQNEKYDLGLIRNHYFVIIN